MRICNLSFSNNMLLNFNSNKSKYFQVNEKILLQTRIVRPSDDPIASTQLAQLRREQAANSQYQTNIERLSGNLATQESAVKGMEQQLLTMMDKLEEAMGGTLSAEEISGYGKELASMLDTAIALINTKDEDGRYLFSGTATDRQSVVFDPQTQTWSYQGNHDGKSSNVSNGVSVQVTTHLASAFGDNLETLNQLKAVSDKMQDGTLNPAEYTTEMSTAFGALKETHGQISSVYTELGGRYSNLELLKNVHEDHAVVTESMMNNLTALNMSQAYIEMTGYQNATLAAQKVYKEIQQFSLFSLI